MTQPLLTPDEDDFRAELDALLPPIPSADIPPSQSHLLAQSLNHLLPQPPWHRRWRTQLDSWWPWLLIRAQIKVVRTEILAASAFVIFLGFLVSLITTQAPYQTGWPLLLLAPLVSAIGIAFLYGDAPPGVREMEFVSAIPNRFILLARLTLLYLFNLVLAILASLILSLLFPHVVLWSLITSWLAPMAFLSSLALLLTIISGSVELSSLSSFILWLIQCNYFLTGEDYIHILTGYSFLQIYQPESQSTVWLLTLLAVTIIVWQVGQEESFAL